MHWSIGDRNSACDQINIELGYLHFVFDRRMIDRHWIDCGLYYYVYRLKDRFIVSLLFENWDFVW